MSIKSWLNKENSSFSLFGSWNKRYFIFNGKTIFYFHDDIYLSEPVKTIQVTDLLDVEPITDKPGYMFYMVTKERIYKLDAPNEFERNRWITSLRYAISTRQLNNEYTLRRMSKDSDEIEELKKYNKNKKK
jgi:hypothetical protein